MRVLLQDLRYAIRQLRRSPGFTAIAVVSLALAIGANTTIFSFANQMLFVKLGVPHPDQLRMFSLTGDEHLAIHSAWGSWMTGPDGTRETTSFSYPAYQHLRKEDSVTDPVFAFKGVHVNVTANGSAQSAQADLVSGNFYAEMQLKPQLGRAIYPSDDAAPGSGAVAVISDAFWHSAFGGASDVIGKTITVDNTPFTIIGVNPRAFTGPEGLGSDLPKLFIPLSMISVIEPGSETFNPLGAKPWWLQLMARKRPGVSDARAEAALTVQLDSAVRATTALSKGDTLPQLRLKDGSKGNSMDVFGVHTTAYVLLGFSGLVLLLACTNIANLMLARATVRTREMSVRMAIGAGRGRIFAQVLTESVLLSAMGGAAGLFLGYLGRNLIPWLRSSSWDEAPPEAAFDWRVFGFTATATLLTGILFGLLPAWRATRAEINIALKEGARGASRRRKSWTGKTIVGFQVALSTMLVISAAFFLRTLLNLDAVDPGFRPEHLILFNVTPPSKQYVPPKDVALHRRLESAFAAISSVQDASLADVPLLAGNMSNAPFFVEGSRPLATTGTMNDYPDLDVVGENFFSVMSIPILAGRGFTAADTETSQPVSIINQVLARKFFPNSNPIGRRFRTSDEGPDSKIWYQIVGICGDTRYDRLNNPNAPLHFELYRQQPSVGGVTYILRTPLTPAQLLPTLRRTIARIDPDLPLTNIRTQQQQIAQTMQQERMFASLTAGFGFLALALACVGIYGIMAYTVSQRTNEIGIRLALGAMREQIRAMVIRETGWLAGVGVVIGLGATLGLIKLIASMLYGLKPWDPVTLGCSTLLLLAVAFVAGWIPAQRASRVDPIDALRSE